MRKWWVWPAALLLSTSLLAAPSRTTSAPRISITPELSASLTRDLEIDVHVKAHKGDAWTRLSRRVTGDAERWNDLADFNDAGDNLQAGQIVRIPFGLLRPELQRDVIRALFPSDAPSPAGWRHAVIGAGVEGESLWKIAEWFTGDGRNYAAIRKANPSQGLSTRKGDVVLVPKELLTPAFRLAEEMEGKNAASATVPVRQPQNDQAQRPSADEDAAEAAVVEAVATGQPSLTYEPARSAGDGSAPRYAVYRLQKGEALYSSVAIRFTGRVFAEDVNAIVDRLVEVNQIADVAKIPVGHPIRIPMDLLLPEYRPFDDPTRLAAEESKRESARMARRSLARNLAGVTIILDAGHGGRDGGTVHGSVNEARYVYDVTCRLKRILEQRSGAKVEMTTKSRSAGYRIADEDILESQNDHVVLTNPRYTLEDAIVGVNLRWYLANSIFARAIKEGKAREKVMFLSIHADSLHPSLRGAMAYIPGERYVRGSFKKSASVYLARAEVRERPMVRHTRDEALEAEGLSRSLAESVIRQIEQSRLKVHPFHPVRDNIVREGREWVPAIIRHNVVPTRALLEICNLGNKRDRELMTSRKWRESVAEAIYRGIVDFYEGRAAPPEKVARGSGGAAVDGAAAREK